MTSLSDKITTDAEKAQSVTNDGVSVTQRSLADQIAADKYLRGVAALDDSTNKNLGLRITQLVPPGAT